VSSIQPTAIAATETLVDDKKKNNNVTLFDFLDVTVCVINERNNSTIWYRYEVGISCLARDDYDDNHRCQLYLF